jgi:hypothetical protein
MRLFLLLVVAIAPATAPAAEVAVHPLALLAATPIPKPLSGVPLRGPTGLRLLVSNDPPVLLNVDTGRLSPVTGPGIRGRPVISVQPVGKDAVVWLDRRGLRTQALPTAELYVVRHGTTVARRIATGWDVAPSADGRAIWVKRFEAKRRCTLAEVALSGGVRRRPRPLPCSTGLATAGATALLVDNRSIRDPRTGRILLPGKTGVWAIAGQLALTSAGSHGPLAVRNLQTGERWPLAWPSEIGGTDRAVVEAKTGLIAVDFADPAYQETGTQVTDVWLLDPASRRFQHLPDMPAAVSLKATFMSWTSDGRLVILAKSGGRELVGLWRPGDKRIAVRRVRLPHRNSGSDAFVVAGD